MHRLQIEQACLKPKVSFATATIHVLFIALLLNKSCAIINMKMAQFRFEDPYWWRRWVEGKVCDIRTPVQQRLLKNRYTPIKHEVYVVGLGYVVSFFRSLIYVD